MRRTRAARIPTRRRLLGFEPLEPRELLAADAGFAYWGASTDDWSWTSDESSSFDTGGTWGGESWWEGDVSWDAPASDGTDFGGHDGTGSDAGVYDWSANSGGVDAGWTGDDVVAPPAPDDVRGAADEPVATVVEVCGPPPPWPDPEVVIATPGVDFQADPLALVGDPAGPPAGGEPDAEGAGELPVVSPPPIAVRPDFNDVEIVVVCNLPPVAGAAAADAMPDAAAPVDESAPADVTDDTADGSWVLDTQLPEGLPHRPTDDVGAADEAVVEVLANDPDAPSTTVIVTPIADRPSSPVAVPVVDVPVVADQSVPTVRATDRFAGLGAIFFQAFGRPAGDADGSLAGGQVDGQPGSGRPRLRLPFRPGA